MTGNRMLQYISIGVLIVVGGFFLLLGVVGHPG